MNENVIYSINGPVVKVKDTKSFAMLEMVYVGNKQLMGEVISINDEFTTIQVYETTTSLKPGEPVISTGHPIMATLGPGIISNIFDGVERPLKKLESEEGSFINAGSNVESLDNDKLWEVKFLVKPGDKVKGGDIFGIIEETSIVEHRLMIEPNLKGKVHSIKEDGLYKLNDVVLVVETDDTTLVECSLIQKWPIKTPRPIKERLPIEKPLITGQRVIDTLFPIGKGGTVALPGGFGTGKTMTQHQIAKWCDADIIIYIGCGERGNEMTQVLEEFSELIDPKSNQPLINRTVLIANTSNMPVAAREASIYTGVTLAEYYRDMGYNVAIMADSTSRWAEALREISGRLEEMPAEEGFPAYLPSRLAAFYERAGYVKTLNEKEGSLTIIGAVSPQGADFSEPVTQNTKRFVRCFLALDKSLAYARHYFAINWNDSYSDYIRDLSSWYDDNVGLDFDECREQLSYILASENKLNEIVKLMGPDILPENQKLVIEIAKIIRVGYLQQNAFHADDTYVTLEKQLKMMRVILYLNKKANEVVDEGKTVRSINETGIVEKLLKMKYDVPNNNLDLFDNYYRDIDDAINSLL